MKRTKTSSKKLVLDKDADKALMVSLWILVSPVILTMVISLIIAICCLSGLI